MSKQLRLSLIAAALLCSALSAWGQKILPEGMGKELVAANLAQWIDCPAK